MRIKNKKTGEVIDVPEDQLGNYGIQKTQTSTVAPTTSMTTPNAAGMGGGLNISPEQVILAKVLYPKQADLISSIYDMQEKTKKDNAPDPITLRENEKKIAEQKTLAGDLRQFSNQLNDVEGLAKGMVNVTESPESNLLGRILGINVESKTGKTLFPKAAAFDASRDSLAYSMASAIANQSGRGLSDADVKIFKDALPGREDSPESAKMKLENTVDKLRRRMLDAGVSESEINSVLNDITLNSDKEATVGSVLKAGGQDIKDLFTGIGDLLKTSAKGYSYLPMLLKGIKRGDITAGEVGKELGKAGLRLGGEVVKGTVNEYKDIATKPVEQATTHPVNTLLAVLPLLQGAKKIQELNQVSKVAKASEAATALDEVANVAGKVDKILPDEAVKALETTGKVTEDLTNTATKAAKLDPSIERILNKAGKVGEKQGVSQLARNVYQSVLSFSKKNNSFERLRPNDTVASMIEYGISGTPDEILNKARTVTGEKGILSNIVNEALADTNVTANLDDMGKIQSLIKQSRNSSKYVKLNNKEFDSIAREVANLPGLSGKGVGEYDLSSLLDYQRTLQKQAQPYRIAGRTDVAAQQMGNFLTDVADEIGTIIDSKVKSVGSIDKYKDPAIINELKKVSPKLADELSKAKSLSDIRALQAPFVRMGQIMDLVLQEPSSLGKNLFRGASQLPVIGPILDTVAQSAAVPLATKSAIGLERGSQNNLIQQILKNLPYSAQ